MCNYYVIVQLPLINKVLSDLRFTSAAVSNNGELMCGGFEDSSVRLWSLTPKKLAANRQNLTDLSQVNFGTGKLVWIKSRENFK